MVQLDEYDTFKDLGKYSPLPVWYKKILLHLVYYGKHYVHRKSGLVADGHLTYITVEIFYYGVVNLRGIWLLAFIDEINKMEMSATDIGNSYLESNTLKEVYIISGT